ncbi:MAG TPA: alpha-amylase family glycosyl hydrolase [Methylomirabilota bacterium]|nr:alpha-amylase family glycosyl hydrolase [Methylomirabilota bacterium]
MTDARANAFTAGGLTPSPIDWRDMWIYFLMVDRFNRTDAPPRHVPWNDPSFDGYQGGTFEGVRAALPYIKELGAGAIWLSPVLKNLPSDRFSYHGYGIHDFLHAEPRLARDPARADDELRELVDAAHDTGLYVIFDIVLNHVGDVFAYVCGEGDATCSSSGGAFASYSGAPLEVRWRDGSGAPDATAADIGAIGDASRDALVWPAELQRNSFYRRQGMPTAEGSDTIGDFWSLKQLRTEDQDLQRALITAYAYVLARWDVDGFRIDTLRYLQGGLPRRFGNAMREFAQSAGKKNFFTFGEVFAPQAEEDIARFIGRHTSDGGDTVGVDAALDYPLFFTLPAILKGFDAPARLNEMFMRRRAIQQGVISSHGDASQYFVTFLDNHDVKQRIRPVADDGTHPHDDQVTLALACLLTLPGIPCVYYGTESGLDGRGTDAAVREAFWGGPGPQATGPFHGQLAALSALRAQLPALRYGRFYLRPLSGDSAHFAISQTAPGVLAYSRILADQEVLVVANTTQSSLALDVIVDSTVNAPGAAFAVRWSSRSEPTSPAPLRSLDRVEVAEADGRGGAGPVLVCPVVLQPREVQILSPLRSR